MVNNNLTRERLLEVLSFDEVTSTFFWKHRSDVRSQWNGKYAGKPAGAVVDGRLQIAIERVKYKAHKLVWLYCYGEFPDKDLDHKNGAPLDNHVDNLREATPTQNGQNKKKRKDSRSQLKGASYCSTRDKYEARIKVKGRHLSLGRFDTAEEAHEAYKKVAQKAFGEFARVA